jgi:hypothetical protein
MKARKQTKGTRSLKAAKKLEAQKPLALSPVFKATKAFAGR